VWCGALRRERATGIGGLVPLPKLPQTQRRTRFRLCGIQAHGLYRYGRRDNQVQFVARQVAGILRQMRLDINLRRRALVVGNTFSCRRLRSSRHAPADEAYLPGRTFAVATFERGSTRLRPFTKPFGQGTDSRKPRTCAHSSRHWHLGRCQQVIRTAHRQSRSLPTFVARLHTADHRQFKLSRDRCC
jgi:hypothetical protein